MISTVDSPTRAARSNLTKAITSGAARERAAHLAEAADRDLSDGQRWTP